MLLRVSDCECASCALLRDISLEKVHFVGLYCIIILQRAVQRTYNLSSISVSLTLSLSLSHIHIYARTFQVARGSREYSAFLTILQALCTNSIQGKGKSVPLQAWTGPEGSRKLRFPDFVTTVQDGGKVVSLKHRPPLPRGKCSWYLFLLEAESTPGP